jgi:hypothetical protein
MILTKQASIQQTLLLNLMKRTIEKWKIKWYTPPDNLDVRICLD